METHEQSFRASLQLRGSQSVSCGSAYSLKEFLYILKTNRALCVRDQ